MNKRDTVLALLALGVAPFVSMAQQPEKVWRIGFLAARRPVSLDTDAFGGFLRGMGELGYVEGKNLAVEWSYADGKLARLPELAAELVRLKVDVIFTAGTPATRAAQEATTTIPIVMGAVSDPVALGFAASLGRPGGNVTGLAVLGPELMAKLLELLKETMPRVARVAVLFNLGNSANSLMFKSMETTAKTLNVRLEEIEVRGLGDFKGAFAAMAKKRVEAVVIPDQAVFRANAAAISELAAKNRLPTISAYPKDVEAGGLMSYGVDRGLMFRRAATYVDKIFKGAKPGDLPIQQPTKFELFINGKTAKALGFKIPQAILLRADRVIE